MESEYKKYTLQAKTGIKGEAFFESLVADYSLPHHIVGPKDIGIDYICEWVFGDAPTGILWAAQVKTFSHENAEPQHTGTETRLNGLEKYTIANSHLKVDERTLRYWKGLGLPMYLFAIIHTPGTDEKPDNLDCYYKRFTPVLTKGENQDDLPYYKVNRGAKFIGFAIEQKRKQGFARDLFIDHMRWSYYKGNIAYLNPRMLGLNQFPSENGMFHDLLGEYKEQVCATYFKTKPFLEKFCGSTNVESV